MKKIIIRTPNFIGDTINTTPCLELIKQEYPEAEFTIVGPDFVRELFKYDPRITHYITFPLKRKKKLSTYWKIVRELRKENGELGVIFVNTFISALLFRLGNVKKNIGYNREGRGFLLDFSPEINYHKHYINRYAFLFNEYIGNKYVYLPELSLRHTGQKTFQFDNSHKTIALYLGGENKEFRKYPDESARLQPLAYRGRKRQHQTHPICRGSPYRSSDQSDSTHNYRRFYQYDSQCRFDHYHRFECSPYSGCRKNSFYRPDGPFYQPDIDNPS